MSLIIIIISMSGCIRGSLFDMSFCAVNCILVCLITIRTGITRLTKQNVLCALKGIHQAVDCSSICEGIYTDWASMGLPDQQTQAAVSTLLWMPFVSDLSCLFFPPHAVHNEPTCNLASNLSYTLHDSPLCTKEEAMHSRLNVLFLGLILVRHEFQCLLYGDEDVLLHI